MFLSGLDDELEPWKSIVHHEMTAGSFSSHLDTIVCGEKDVFELGCTS